MVFKKCDLCLSMTNDKSHKSCKFVYFDLLKDVFKKDYEELENKILIKENENKELSKENQRLSKLCLDLQEKQLNLVEKLKNVEKELECSRTLYVPGTPTSQNLSSNSLNKAICHETETITDRSQNEDEDEDIFNLNIIQPTPIETFKKEKSNTEHSTHSNETSFESSDEEISKIEIPKRKHIPCRESEPKWTTKGTIKKSNSTFGSFYQPIERSVRELDQIDEVNENRPPKIEVSPRSRNKKLRQTYLSFKQIKQEKNQENIPDDETFCEDLIQPTPEIFTHRNRSSTRNGFSDSKLFEFNNKSASSLKNNTKESNDSVFAIPEENEVIFVADSPALDFGSDDSLDLLSNVPIKSEKGFEYDLDNNSIKLKDESRNELRSPARKKFSASKRNSPLQLKSDNTKKLGFDCPDCEKYYALLGDKISKQQLQQKLNQCSKHRKNVRLHETPEGFWNPCFTPTQN